MNKFYTKQLLKNKSLKFKNFATKKFPKPNFKWIYGTAAIMTSCLLIRGAEMNSESDNYLKVDEVTRKQILKSMIYYPKTASVIDDKPLIQIEVEELTDDSFNGIIKQVETDVNLQAMHVLKDVMHISNTMILLRQPMLLDKVDMIQIHKGGLNVVRIVITNNKNGRSACVEINNVSMSIMDILKARSDMWNTVLSYTGWIVTGVIGTIYFVSK